MLTAKLEGGGGGGGGMGGAVEMVGAGATLRNGFPAEDEVEKGPPDGSPKSWSREKNG